MKNNKTLVRLVCIVLVFTLVLPLLASCENVLTKKSAGEDDSEIYTHCWDETPATDDAEDDGWNPRPWNPEEDEENEAGSTNPVGDQNGYETQSVPPIPSLTEVVLMLDEAMISMYPQAKLAAEEDEPFIETYVPLGLHSTPMHVLRKLWGDASQEGESPEGVLEAKWVLGVATIPELEGDRVQLCTIHVTYNEKGYVTDSWASGLLDPEPLLPSETIYSLFDPGDNLEPITDDSDTE